MKCIQMDMICNIFGDLSRQQSIIATDILRILYSNRKYGMDIVELNQYFRNRYIHSVRSTVEWLKSMGYITKFSKNEPGVRYIITLTGIKRHWEICSIFRFFIFPVIIKNKTGLNQLSQV